jgi:biopolymer transport protein ExbD
LTIDVIGDGTVQVMGRTCRPEELSDLLAAADMPQVKILCGANVPYMYVQDVMDRCRQAGIFTVSFGTSPDAREPQPAEEG